MFVNSLIYKMEKMIDGIVFALFIHLTCSSLIPKDVEILNGYQIEGPIEGIPPQMFYEDVIVPNSMFNQAIRNRRSYLTKTVLDLNDSQNISESLLKMIAKRKKRNIDTIENASTESIPTPEKQVGNSDIFRNSGWNIKTLNTDYSQNDDNDNIGEESSNDGIKGRTPHVNFVTQPKTKIETNDRHRGLRINEEEPQYYNDNPIRSDNNARSHESYTRRYDRLVDNQPRYNSYYNNQYSYRSRAYPNDDNYGSRIIPYHDRYFDYLNGRYDGPEPRDYHPSYYNDIIDQRIPLMPPRRTPRIIYYAYLPEVVRAPPIVDLTYKYTRKRYDDGYGFNGGRSGTYRSNEISRNNYDFLRREKKERHITETNSEPNPILNKHN